MRRVHLIGFTWAYLLVIVSARTSFAQAPSSPAPMDYCWADAATGKRVRTRPASLSRSDIISASDPNHYTNSTTGQNFSSQPDGSWIDSATGQPVDTLPADINVPDAIQRSDPNHATNSTTGRNYVRVPCPPPPTQTAGVYLGGEILKNIGRSTLTEESALTGAVTNQFDETGDPLGGGIVIGDNFKLRNRNLLVGPFVAFDFLNQTINHTFASTTFLGTTAHWTLATGAKVGIVTSSEIFVYGRGAISWLSEDLNINFGVTVQGAVQNDPIGVPCGACRGPSDSGPRTPKSA